MTRSYDLEFRLERAKKMSRAMVSKGWSRGQLARKAGYDEKTIRNVLNGEPTRDSTIIDICRALEIDAELESTIEHVDVSDDVFGGYNRSQYKGYESTYKLFRRSYSEKDKIYKTFFKLEWDECEERFAFSEYYVHHINGTHELKCHTGAVYISTYTGLLHFVTIYQGSVRLASVSKMREPDGIMRGAILTQYENVVFFQPTCSSIVLKRMMDFVFDNSCIAEIGLIGQDDDEFDFAKSQLELTEAKFIKTALS